MRCDALVIGAGPGGLHCAKLLASRGLRVIVLERSETIGKKVCAGGITWSGMIKRIPDALLERSFSAQTVQTRWQHVQLSSDHPLIGTVNRQKLGDYMTRAVLDEGASVLNGVTLEEIEDKRVSFRRKGKRYTISFDYLIGADGSNSRVRSYLGLRNEKTGIGLNCMISGNFDEMIWNFDSKRFGSGYAWIFPHRDCASFGAYSGNRNISAKKLKQALLHWMKKAQITPEAAVQSGTINCHYEGWSFRHIFLVGDAAGLASPLTGEGIFPAIVSAEAVADTILDTGSTNSALDTLLLKRHKHEKLQAFAAFNPLVSHLLAELSALLLKRRMITFENFEMA